MIKKTKTKYLKEFYYYSKDSVIGKSLSLYGEYAQRELDFLSHILNKNCVVYDIGGNIGYHAVAFASCSKYVYTFEPNKQNYELLLKNISSFDNVCPVNAAVTNINTFVNVQDFDTNVSSNYGNVKIGSGQSKVIAVKLDDFNIEKPDLVKIDVEGCEYQVLLGMEQIIQKYLPWIYFEAHETKELPEIIRFLQKYNYNMYWCEVMNYNDNNFNKNKKNVFENSGTFSILVVPKQYNKFAMDEVLGPDDTVQKLNARVQARNEK